ncbi:MAG: Lrp/AsnC family transcriptional regulator [Algibacter sp.]
MQEIDEFDKKILELLDKDGRIPFLSIAKKLDISNTMAHQRVSKLIDNGVIESIRPILNEKKVGYDLGAFTGITLEKDYVHDEVIEALKKIPEITECYFIAGDFTFFVRIVAKNSDDLRHLLYQKIDKIPGVYKTVSMIDLGCAFKRNIIL